MLEFLHTLLADYTLRTVAIGSAVLGLVSGMLGSFAVLRKQSLLGDAISHSALPGIALAFLLTGSKAPLVLILGAAVAGWIATYFILSIVNHSRVKTDSAMGLILSVFFGIGLVLLTYIQTLPNARQAGLETFLFGQASAMLERDVIVMAVLGATVLLLVLLFWKEFKLLCFDPSYGSSLGFPMRLIDLLLVTLLVVAIVIGLQTVGVVLMSAMVVAPAAAARQWTDRLSGMVLLSGLFGALAGVFGALISSTSARLPTGPIIIVCISAIVTVSLLFAPNRGVVFNRLRGYSSRKKMQTDTVLVALHELAAQHGDPNYPHTVPVLAAMSPNPQSVPETLKELGERGLARETAAKEWALTDRGHAEANAILGRLGVKR